MSAQQSHKVLYLEVKIPTNLRLRKKVTVAVSQEEMKQIISGHLLHVSRFSRVDVNPGDELLLAVNERGYQNHTMLEGDHITGGDYIKAVVISVERGGRGNRCVMPGASIITFIKDIQTVA